MKGDAPLKLAARLRQHKFSVERKLCLVEGWKCYAEASARSAPWATILDEEASAPFAERFGSEVSEKTWTVNSREMKKLCDTLTPEGILGIFPRPAVREGFPDFAGLHLALMDWRNPGNVGAAVRTARGLGASSVTLWGSGPDFFSPKVIRGAMGSVFHLPLFHAEREALPPAACSVLLGDAAGEPVDRLALPDSEILLLVIGSESGGIGEELGRLGPRVCLPLSGGLESLGAPTAAALLLDRLTARRKQCQNG
ncbi:MAG: hypothetical protein HQL31_09735 [Planctomycetes bacterium]|nr:hypothetical protein [Planctomycetota bacterium]